MLKIDRRGQTLLALDTPNLADVAITERYELQEFISNSPDAFFGEIGQQLFLLGKEVEPSKNIQDRIDLLAVDKEGATVVVELKRGAHKLHMFQAISYAGMIASWLPDDLLNLLDEERQEALADFLEVDREEINRRQRIVLVAEAYDYALLVGAEWLSENHGVDLTCCRIALASDPSSKSEYLVCSIVYPAPELAREAIVRGRKTSRKVRWADWETALSPIQNQNVVSFFTEELEKKRESYLRKRILRFRSSGERRWSVAARTKRAYVWQRGRFADDLDFWAGRLSEADEVRPVKNGTCLRFFLNTEQDFRQFHEAATRDLQNAVWTDGQSESDEDMEENT